MDINDLRSGVTLLSFLFFLGLVVWTLRPSRRRDHDEAAQLVFEGELPIGDISTSASPQAAASKTARRLPA